MKNIILASASMLAMIAVPAHAQDAPVGTADQAGLDDIIVTAQRTQETAQKAPLPIAVVQPEDLTRQNVTRAEDLSRLVPALVATASGGPNTSFFLRGVGNTTVNSYSDPAIAFNYDGVYIGRPNSTQGFFYDLQRIEVLKGPQGTLYGRNATGGAINVIPNRPKIGETSGEFQASYGNYDAIQAQGALNLPIGDRGAFRIAAAYNKRDGYLSDGTGDQDSISVRGQLLAELTPNLTTRFGADFSHQGGVGSGAYVYGTTFLISPTAGYGFAPTPDLGPKVGMHDPRSEAFLQTRFITQAGRRSEPLGSYPRQDNSVWGFTNETNWETDAGTLTVQAAYRESDVNSLSTSSNFRGFIIDEHAQQFSLETRFAGKIGDAADYLIGAYYFDEDIENSSAINQLTSLPIQDYTTGTESKAVFGRLAVHVTDTLTLIAAGRYTDDDKRFDGLSNVYTVFCGAPTPPQDNCPTVPLMPLVTTAAEVVAFYTARGIAFGPPGSRGPNTPTINNTRIAINSSTRDKKFTYRLAADWQVTPRNMIYASFETGFHGGGFSFARGLDSYDPETIEAYTIGSKNRFFDNRLQLNVELFYWKYKDQQVSQFGFDLGTPPASVFYTSNIGRSTNKGIDVDVDFLATPTTRLTGSVQYLDATYDDFITYSPNSGTVQAPGPLPNFNCPATPVIFRGTNSFAIDCSGKDSLFSPKWSFNLGVEQTIELSDYNLVAQGGTRYRGDFFAATTYFPWVVSPAGFQSDASLTLAPKSDRWFVTAYVNNIENTRRLAQANVNLSVGTMTGLATAPRTYGLRIGGKF
ncbi:TonB-dependent receptor [Sphingopyxis sp.]|uniref:TonB-dependent receptor n=1 Tax=Sphingopyxis sp. TaxID=1908224 RepID=UPI003D0AB030